MKIEMKGCEGWNWWFCLWVVRDENSIHVISNQKLKMEKYKNYRIKQIFYFVIIYRGIAPALPDLITPEVNTEIVMLR